MNNIPAIHYKKDKNDLVKSYFIALIPLLIFSFYKNGLLLYFNNLTNITSIFIPLYFYLISILVAVVVSIIFKENKLPNILKSLIISLSISINTNYLIYPILLMIMFIITKYLKLKTKVVFNDIALIRIFLVLSLLLNSYSYLNIAEKLHNFNYNLFDIFLGFGVGGLASSSLIILIIVFSFLLLNKFYKKYIPLTASLSFVIISLIYIIISHNTEFLNVLLSGHIYYSFIIIAPDLSISPSNNKGMIIYGILIGILTSVIAIFFNIYEAGFISIFLISLLIPFINKFTNKKYLQN